MTRDEAFEFLDRTARGIAETFGSSCETLVHDMGLPSHPILSIYNGHVSGREVGSTVDILGNSREAEMGSPPARSRATSPTMIWRLTPYCRARAVALTGFSARFSCSKMACLRSLAFNPLTPSVCV